MTGVVQDLGYALRQLGKNRAFVVVAVGLCRIALFA